MPARRIPLLEAADDDDGLVHVWYALAWVGNMRQQFEEWAQAMETAVRHARRAGHPVLGVFALALSVPLAYGPRPAGEALATLDVVVADHPFPGALLMRALLLAMLDRMDEAWAVALPAEERLRELAFATGGAWLGEIALLAGDYEAAASYLRDACDAVEAIGNEGELSTYAPMLGRVLCQARPPRRGRAVCPARARARPSGGHHDPARLAADAGARLTPRADSTPRRNASLAKQSTSRCGATPS